MRRAAPAFLLLSLAACARRAPVAPPPGSTALVQGRELVLARASGAKTVLSAGLAEASAPMVSPDGLHLYFEGRPSRCADPQIYEAFFDGAPPRPVTNVPGGAASPAVLADGTVVFVSPASGARGSALWAQAPAGGEARRLTFGPSPVSDPFVLGDGRVLFVSNGPADARPALYAVNLDGTGVLPYALQHDGPAFVRRPRETGEGRVVYLAADLSAGPWRTEAVATARPWKERTALAADPLGEGVPVTRRARMPLGRLSTVNPAKTTGVLLCLDANRSTLAGPAAVRVRITTRSHGATLALGEVPLAADGSFAAEVPADVPLGIEALDGDGRVLRALAPFIWVRPGESRGCIGCHEEHGMAPRNRRPLAVGADPVRVGPAGTLAAGKAL